MLRHRMTIMSVWILALATAAASSGQQTVTVTSSSPTHAKLAALANNSTTIPSSEISRWKRILDGLSAKCQDETRKQISDYLVAGHGVVKKRGKNMAMIDFVRFVDQSLPKEIEPDYKSILNCRIMTTTVATRIVTGEKHVIVDARVGY